MAFSRIVPLAGIAVVLACGGCGGQKYSEGGLEFRGWYIVKPVVTGTGSVAYGSIHNESGSVKNLTGADFACAASTALHETVVEGDRIRMAPLPGLAIAEGAAVAFEPGHKHVMLGTLKPDTAETCDAEFRFGTTAVKFKIPLKAREK